MIKDISYIIKRIIIGVGIALALMFIKSNVFALTSSYSFGNQTLTFDTAYNGFRFDTSGSPWSGAGEGDLTFSFAVVKTSGGATDSNSILRSVHVNASNGAMFSCNVGTTTITNSTFNNGLYSVSCPVSFPAGVYLSNVVLAFEGNGNLQPSYYSLRWNGLVTFSSKPSTSVSVDTSGTTSAVNNQTQSIVNNQNQNTQSIINNQNSNTQSIINNQNSNNQALINNQNSNTDKEIESQKVCSFIDNNSIVINDSFLDSDGSIGSNNTFGISDYIPITSSSVVTPTSVVNSTLRYYCFYNINKSLISCSSLSSMSVDTPLVIPSNTSYLRSSIQRNTNRPTFRICDNGNQAIVNSQQEINNTINNDNVDGASSEASSFFDDFQANSHGLSGIITAPLRLIESLSSSTCSSLVLPLPFVSQNATLPCMSTVYNQFPSFYSLWQLITTGMIAYYILIKLFGHVKGMQNPNDDRIEVLNL